MSRLKNTIIRQLARFQYPQIVFAREIVKEINKQGRTTINILDCPCGNGEVSYLLSRIKGAEVTGADIDETSISIAQKNYPSPHLHFKKKDIFELLSDESKYDIICLVNSLFLLTEHTRLLRMISASLKDSKSHLFLIIPNIKGKNFINFTEENPGVNLKTYSQSEMIGKLEESGFRVRVNGSREIVLANRYGRKELKYFSVLAPFYLRALDGLNRLFSAKKGNYIFFDCIKRDQAL
jgi:2-polyprenyl-3-methyl-5-hydroxy-6-metoxy-1,4-benzoquinol methylase